MDLRHVLNCMISVSDLGRGQASKVIQAIEETGNPYIIIKNNKPQAVIISIQDYMDYQRSRDLLAAMQAYSPYEGQSPMPQGLVPEGSVSDPGCDYTNALAADPEHSHANLTSNPLTAPVSLSSLVPNLTHDELDIFLNDEEGD
ncbi:MAG: type II toxin-antitoxin system Phd/YefM family antitoxin [Peptococcaceae bacterium]|nr:type II toxin-antitoxin system Phd/YefM family antitoxin [Peptococcaceae bacterium]